MADTINALVIGLGAALVFCIVMGLGVAIVRWVLRIDTIISLLRQITANTGMRSPADAANGANASGAKLDKAGDNGDDMNDILQQIASGRDADGFGELVGESEIPKVRMCESCGSQNYAVELRQITSGQLVCSECLEQMAAAAQRVAAKREMSIQN